MYSPNILAHLIVKCARAGRTFTSEQRATLVGMLPSTTGMVHVLCLLALRYYSVEVG